MLIIVLVFASKTFAQYELEKRKYVKYIRIDYLYSIDKDSCLGKDLMKSTDSIKCISFNGYNWFYFAENLIDRNKIGRFVAVDEVNNKLFIIPDSAISMYSVYSSIDDLDIFNNMLFTSKYYDVDTDKGKVGGLKISLVDMDKIKIKKEIYLENKARFRSMYEKNDSLYIEVQPMEASINYFYFFSFWIREVHSLYNYDDCGNKIRYVFDKSFNLVRKEEVFP
jgi:hypothetical protein